MARGRGDGVRRGAAKQGSSLGRGSRLALLERCRGARCDAAGTQRRKKIERRCARSVTTRMRLRCMTRRPAVSGQGSAELSGCSSHRRLRKQYSSDIDAVRLLSSNAVQRRALMHSTREHGAGNTLASACCLLLVPVR